MWKPFSPPKAHRRKQGAYEAGSVMPARIGCNKLRYKRFIVSSEKGLPKR